METSEIPTAPGPETSEDVFQNMTEYDLHETPVVLLELQDELARSRRREALWISVVVHLLVVIAIATSPKWAYPVRGVVVMTPADILKQQEMTYLALPPDAQKVTEPPKTDIISDKNRIASSKIPSPNQKELRKILDSARPGPPSQPGAPQPPTPPAQQQQMAQAPQPQNPVQQQAQRGGGGPQLPPSQNQSPRLESLSPGGGSASANNPFRAAMSAGSAIEQAARATVGSRGVGGGAGDYGLGTGRQGGTVHSQLDILSDTRGVDFGPYLERILHTVRLNWYNLIPEVARPPLMKEGKVSIEFAILKNGQVAGMRLAGQSGDISLDRAAWGGITASNPFPPLPGEFSGEYLALRFHFYYNPRSNSLQ
ncbi:MAG TPA: TonB family protein [Terriglobales bacterium]|nr:TonB family protein [Terriglobales bacterium]